MKHKTLKKYQINKLKKNNETSPFYHLKIVDRRRSFVSIWTEKIKRYS